jgi:methionyl-tRNA formyltransferase
MRHTALFVGSFNPPAVAVMRAWLAAGHRISAFWRGVTPTMGPVRRDRRLSVVLPRWSVTALARERGFPVRDVPRLSSWPDAEQAVRATGADILISVYFPFVVPAGVLEIFGPRALNFHPAPLPRYRGPSPVQAMVLDRSVLTDGAMTLHVMTPGLDEGPIVAREPVPFPEDLRLDHYRLALAEAAGRLARESLPRYLAGDLHAAPQDVSQASYARVMSPDLALSPRLSADDIEWRCRTFAADRPLEIAGLGGVRIIGFAGRLGPATGAPPEVGPLSVALDVADARIRLRRKLPMVRQIRRLRGLLLMARTPVV